MDDIWGLWEHGEEKLKEFHQKANEIHSRIKTELRYSNTKIEFLDVNVSINDGYFKTNIFSKETDKHLYIHATSNNPDSVKNAIPYGLGIRARRICSDNETYKTQRNEIKRHLQNRGYQEKNVEEQLQRIDKMDRGDLLRYNRKKQNNRVPLVLTYSNALPNIHDILRKNMGILHQSEKMKKIFNQTPIVSFKRDKNIMDILVHKKHNRMFYYTEYGCKRCGKNCALCKYLIENNVFSDNDGNQFKIKGSINCKSVGVIYCIFCTKCSKNIYVGQTGDTFYQRMLLNFSKIRTKKITDPIAKHFCEKEHSVNNYRVIGIERVYGDTIYRETKEAFWIKKLKTYEPQGLNTKLLCR